MVERPVPYLDGRQPSLRPSIVGFVDMLGFSAMSTADVDAAQSQQLLARIVTAVESARGVVREYLKTVGDFVAPEGWSVKYFSDNLVLGVPTPLDGAASPETTEFALRCTHRYQLHLALSGFFIRGGLTHGLVCLTDEIVFGPALIDSYLLESKTAIVPRIVVTEPLHRIVGLHRDAQADVSPAERRDLICRDVDGWWFVNYLDAARTNANGTEAGIDWSAVARHKESILASLSSTTRHDVLPKFGWACRYHNVFCHWHRDEAGYSDRYRIDRVDEQSTIARLSADG